ncbi:polysaccharide deacetylase family protein [Cohnella sp. WQ 127256]|uniref:polysaccharide deacetylase family protein n=1 Tax=Cohnella sp. WQ 127256 TaxID=2938790 RepID=UPI0021190DF8|nr:polysaccharide deacetylase family protein [Cohnella sp. WQ 127256]
MKKKVPIGLLTAMLVCLSIVLLVGMYGPIEPFVQAVKPQAKSTTALFNDRSEDQLMKWIKSEAIKYNKPPINAVIDRVWKAIPGYDGRVVDVQATYLKAKVIGSVPGEKNGFPWIYRTDKPKVDIKDLPLNPIYRGNPEKPMVALMINVAWGDEYLIPMLDILKDTGVKATFFFDGSWLAKHIDTAKSIIEQGHEVSNHAYTHPDMSRLGLEKQREEIGKTEALLKMLGVKNVWFAPPSGDYNTNTVKVASEYGLRTVLWTLDTVDWMKPAPSTVIDKISRKVGPGSLILMHPTSTSQGALRGMIKVIRAKGYLPGTVSETLSTERIEDRL